MIVTTRKMCINLIVNITEDSAKILIPIHVYEDMYIFCCDKRESKGNEQIKKSERKTIGSIKKN